MPGDGERFPLEKTQFHPIDGQRPAHEIWIAISKCVHLAARIVLESNLIRRFQPLAQASVCFPPHDSFGLSATEISAYADGHFSVTGRVAANITAHCFGSCLRLESGSSSGNRRRLRLSPARNGNAVRLIFREKAEVQCLPGGSGLDAQKYLREALMQRFNAFLAAHLPH